jgi:hypothetical protein
VVSHFLQNEFLTFSDTKNSTPQDFKNAKMKKPADHADRLTTLRIPQGFMQKKWSMGAETPTDHVSRVTDQFAKIAGIFNRPIRAAIDRLADDRRA